MDHLPIFYDVKGKPVIIVGSGTLAARRADMARRAGAKILLFADKLSEEFIDLEKDECFEHIRDTLEQKHFKGVALAYAATENDERDRQVHDLARAASVPVNVADSPDLCDFITPSILDRSPLVVGISTAGTSPILGRMIKARLETMIPAAYGQFSNFLGHYRHEVLSRIKDGALRRRFWERVMDGPVLDFVLSGHEDDASAEMEHELSSFADGDHKNAVGEVYLIGAGPGDPDLLTFRALRLMQRADIVLYDRLVGDGILNLVRRDAERVYVGKQAKDHSVPQEEISQWLVDYARQGKRVLRLKGGDSFIFGRGGEEIETLSAEGIPFQVVPGITSASGAATYAGLPLPHRDHAQAVIFVTGHGKDGRFDLEWETLIQPSQTVCIYMGLTHLPELMGEFIRRGADKDLAAAAIFNGTRRNQHVITGTISTLSKEVAASELRGPAMIVIGTVVTLREKLNWFEPGSKRREIAEVHSKDTIRP